MKQEFEPISYQSNFRQTSALWHCFIMKHAKNNCTSCFYFYFFLGVFSLCWEQHTNSSLCDFDSHLIVHNGPVLVSVASLKRMQMFYVAPQSASDAFSSPLEPFWAARVKQKKCLCFAHPLTMLLLADQIDSHGTQIQRYVGKSFVAKDSYIKFQELRGSCAFSFFLLHISIVFANTQ